MKKPSLIFLLLPALLYSACSSQNNESGVKEPQERFAYFSTMYKTPFIYPYSYPLNILIV